MPEIKRAVIPAAGFGTRMLRLVADTPKELLPIGGEPMIQRVIDEVVASGLTDVCVVIRPGKEDVKRFILSHYCHPGTTRWVGAKGATSRVRVHFRDQMEPSGLGGALLAASDFLSGGPFVMAIPDLQLRGIRTATVQLLEHCAVNQSAIWSSLVALPRSEAPYFTGPQGVRCGHFHDRVCRIRSRYPIDNRYHGFGRTVLQPEALSFIENDPDRDYVRALNKLSDEISRFGVLLEGTPLDFGTSEGFRRYAPMMESHPPYERW